MTSTPHDALFKAAFEQPAHAADLFRQALPREVVAAIDWAGLRRESGSFVAPDLADRHSDLLFAAELAGRQVLLYLLLEHQSDNDPDMPLRVLTYLVRIWERHRKDHPRGPLPIIVPLVISHAPGGWTSPRSLHAMLEPDPATISGLSPLVPELSLLVEDLEHLSDSELHIRAVQAFPRLALWVLRDARDPARLAAAIDRWCAALQATAVAESGMQAVAQVIRYITLVADDLHLDTFRAKLRQLAPAAEQAAMTIAEQLRREGREQGREEGRAAALTKLVRLKFGEIGAEAAERIAAATPTELDRWVERILSADSLDELFEA